MLNDVTVFNIREYLSAKGDKDLGEDELRQLLSEFFCDKNHNDFLTDNFLLSIKLKNNPSCKQWIV